jgi:hypothetical protein
MRRGGTRRPPLAMVDLTYVMLSRAAAAYSGQQAVEMISGNVSLSRGRSGEPFVSALNEPILTETKRTKGPRRQLILSFPLAGARAREVESVSGAHHPQWR